MYHERVFRGILRLDFTLAFVQHILKNITECSIKYVTVFAKKQLQWLLTIKNKQKSKAQNSGENKQFINYYELHKNKRNSAINSSTLLVRTKVSHLLAWFEKYLNFKVSVQMELLKGYEIEQPWCRVRGIPLSGYCSPLIIAILLWKNII